MIEGKRMRSGFLLVVVGLSLSIPATSSAQPKGSATQADINARADDLFRKGREEQDRGNCQKALEHFRESHALKPGRGTLLNMGLCEKKLGQLAKALQHLEELLPQLPTGDERRQIVRDALNEIKPKVPYLRIVLRADSPAGTVVAYDDAELAPTMIGTDIPVDPGKHVIVVEAPGLPNRKYDIVMEEGKRQTLNVEPGVRGEGPVPEASKPSPSNPQRTAGFVVGGFGLASLVTGVLLAPVVVSDYREAEIECPTHRGCNSKALELADRGQTMAVLNTVFLAAGVVAIGVSIPLIVTSKKSAPAAAANVWMSPDGARLGLTGQF
jgi:hypothetical protein